MVNYSLSVCWVNTQRKVGKKSRPTKLHKRFGKRTYLSFSDIFQPLVPFVPFVHFSTAAFSRLMFPSRGRFFSRFVLKKSSIKHQAWSILPSTKKPDSDPLNQHRSTMSDKRRREMGYGLLQKVQSNLNFNIFFTKCVYWLFLLI